MIEVRIDRKLGIRHPAGDPLLVRYQRMLTSQVARELLGTFAFTVFRRDRTVALSVASTKARNVAGDIAEMRVAPAAIAALYAQRGLHWAVHELLVGDLRGERLFGGTFDVTAGPADLVIGLATAVSPRAYDFIDEELVP